MFITKSSLPRRTFLRGMGTMLALPLLDAMVPAASALAQTPRGPCAASGSSTSRWGRTGCSGSPARRGGSQTSRRRSSR